MRKYGKWVLTLGLIAASPSISIAGVFGQNPTGSSETTQGTRRTNQQVAEDIAQALRAAKLAGYEIEIGYQGGVATLKGKIADARQKEQATRVVSSVEGVRSVRNEMTLMTAAKPATGGIQQVNYTQQSPASNNQHMAEQVAAALREARLDGYDIEIRFENGVAMLNGHVADARQWGNATQAASRVPGVTAVDNRMQVASAPGQGPAARPMPPQGAPGHPGYPGQIPAHPASYQPGAPGMPAPGMPMAAPGAMPPDGMMMGPGGIPAAQTAYNVPNLPEHAWPTYAAYPNYAGVTYPSQYSASAFPYIGPFYPYPQVPLGWRQAQLEWDDGMWNLNFRPRTDRWWWFMNPHNW